MAAAGQRPSLPLGRGALAAPRGWSFLLMRTTASLHDCIWHQVPLCGGRLCPARGWVAPLTCNHWGPVAPTRRRPPPVVTKHTSRCCQMSPERQSCSWLSTTGTEERRWGPSEGDARLAECGLHLSCVLPGMSQKPWASVFLSLNWKDREGQTKGIWK